ncbi:MAG TPA: TonB-dependent receptor [Saprospirales bacterium]|nr:TonB-dependent receptor [Saprospirales bacterium]
MKSKYIAPLVALLLASFSLSAQKIAGSVLESNGQPAGFSTITLHKSADSTLVKGAITGEDGSYEILGAGAGQYFLKANLMGSGGASTPAFDYDGGNKIIETISLKPAENQLAEVSIIARKPPVEVKADKTILNVDGTVNSTGLNALELLRKAPGVTVDNNENVSVRGKNAVKIMIDGRDVPLDGKELAALLKGTQASDIANIEIISNPSAKYDAAGNAGIINIRMKKNKALGTNGNLGLEGIYGETFKAGGNVSLNHRAKDFNAFGSFNMHHGDWHNTQNFHREQFQDNLRADGLPGEDWRVFEQKNKEYSENRYKGYRAGVDWFVNSKHTVGVLVNGSLNPGDWHSSSVAQISDLHSINRIDSLLVASNDVANDRNDLNINLNYRFADTLGHTLNIDLDRGTYRIRGASFQPNYYRSADNSETLREAIYRNNTPTDIDIMTARVDYEQKLWKGTLGLGGKISDVETFNTFDFFNVQDGVPVKNELQSNSVDYKERTNAAYVNYNRAFGKKWNIQAGLRLENTDYKGIGKDSVFTNNYTELFPSAAVTYTINQKLGLNATYSRRIDRPSYQDLNPFENKLDELTYQKGNPMLLPQFTNSIELSPTFNGFPVLTIGYSHTNDVFTQILKRDTRDTRATFITQENLADQRNWTLTLNAPTPIAKWWDGFVSLTGFRSHFRADFSTPETPNFLVDQAFNAFNAYAEQNIKLPKGFGLQVSGWYNSRAFWGTLRSKPQGALDIGLQKKVFNDKGELRLRVGDVLGTAGWGGENLFTPGLKMLANGTWESQTVTLNFSYRFGSTDVKGARQRKTGLEDEKNRVKGK